MKQYKKQTTNFLLQFGNNIDLARKEIDNVIRYYELKNDKDKIDELFNVKRELV